jgi:hypothetical protein
MFIYVSSVTEFEVWFYFESDTEANSDKMTVLTLFHLANRTKSLTNP